MPPYEGGLCQAGPLWISVVSRRLDSPEGPGELLRREGSDVHGDPINVRVGSMPLKKLAMREMRFTYRAFEGLVFPQLLAAASEE